MTRHLRPVEQPCRPRRLNSRREIDAWLAERKAMLTALVEAEGLGQGRQHTPEVEQLSFEERAA